MDMKSTSPSSFPANYVTLKDLQERWIKRKQDEENEANLRRQRKQEEENEANLRRLQQQQEIKSHNEKNVKDHQPKSKKPIRSTAKSGRKRGSGGSRLPPTDSKSTVEISGKREERQGKKGLESERGDRTAEICRRVAGLSVAGGDDRRGGRGEVGGGWRGKGGGGRPAVSGSCSGMVWVRKTTKG